MFLGTLMDSCSKNFGNIPQKHLGLNLFYGNLCHHRRFQGHFKVVPFPENFCETASRDVYRCIYTLLYIEPFMDGWLGGLVCMEDFVLFRKL